MLTFNDSSKLKVAKALFLWFPGPVEMGCHCVGTFQHTVHNLSAREATNGI